jgi:hypothetical protein
MFRQGDLFMKMLLMRVLAAFWVIAFSASSASAQEPLTEAKRADIMRLVQMTGSGQIGLQMSDAMVQAITDNMKTMRQDIPPRLVEIVREEVMKLIAERIGGLVALIVPVYHQNFTHEDIKGMLQFYGTPLGRKAIQAMPAIMKQSMAAGQAWGESLGPVIQERLRARFAAEGIK